eukprot:Skav221195  [mRNA]  locus=scaffold3557:154947:158653:+ [translate_table: standard]
MDEAKKILVEMVQELYENNSYRIPAVKKIRDATGLTLKEAKDLLDEAKPLLTKPKKAAKGPAVSSGNTSVEKGADPPAEAETSAAPVAAPEPAVRPGSSTDKAAEVKSAPKSEAPTQKYEVAKSEVVSQQLAPEVLAPELGETQPGLEVAETQLDTPSRDFERTQSQRNEKAMPDGLFEDELDAEMEAAAGPARPAPETSPLPSPTTPADSAVAPVKAAPADPKPEDLPTSKTHKAQWNRLSRVAVGPRAKAYPQLASLWNGTPDDKRKALHQYLLSEENLEACEAQLVVKRGKLDTMSHRRKWMTIRQMKDAQFSEAKIQAVVLKGGKPDTDAPNDPASIRYRVSVELEEEEQWQQEAELDIRAPVDVRSAEALMRSADPVVQTITAPDPMALVRDQLAKLDSEKASVAPAESGELKKELSNLQSLKLDLEGQSSSNIDESARSITAAIGVLTVLFQRPDSWIDARAYRHLGKSNLTITDCIRYFQLPMNDSEGQLTMVDWPMMLPHLLAGPLVFSICMAS